MRTWRSAISSHLALAAFSRERTSPESGSISVRRSWTTQGPSGSGLGPTKSEAGERTVTIPSNVLPRLERHLHLHVGPEKSAWLFEGKEGNPIAPRTIDRVWSKARQAVNRTDVRFHDLRHSGLTWAASAGASTAELMLRGGHSTPSAALRYQHATADRDRVIADALASLASGEVLNLRRTQDGHGRNNASTAN